MKEEIIKKAVRVGIFTIIIAMVFIMVIVTNMKYNEEGEKNLPFKISKIAIISTAEGIEETKAPEDLVWKLNVIQNNDIYISIAKNEEYKKEEYIKSIKIENIKVTKSPKIGNIKAYMPNSLDGKLYEYKDEYIITENLQYTGSTQNNAKTLEVGNQGGNIQMSFSNSGIGTYNFDEKSIIKHDGSLIGKLERNKEDLEFSVSFDVIIELKNKKYKTNINLDLPCGNIIQEGKSTCEITDTEHFIYKRVK